MSEQPTSNKVLAAAKAHFRSLGLPSITITEWTVDDRPVKIFWKPLTVEERQDIFENDGKDIDIFVRKAMDAEGNRLFNLEDKVQLRFLVAPQIISRVAAQMMALATPEAVEKN